jgi:hypothetical protein
MSYDEVGDRPPPARLWSVTTLIKLGLGTSDPLVNWAVNTTAAAAYDRIKILNQFADDGDRDGAISWLIGQRWQKSGKAMARGTELHKAAEKLALGKDPEVEEHIQPYLEQYLKFLNDHHPEFLMAEAPVYNLTHGYAGTLDAIVRLEGEPLVADIKTTEWGPDALTPRGDPKMRPPFPEVALQLCGYRRAELVGLLAERREVDRRRYYVFDHSMQHEPMPETSGAVCVVISPVDYTVTLIRTDELVWKSFRHVIACARWTVEVSRQVIGAQVRPQVAN